MQLAKLAIPAIVLTLVGCSGEDSKKPELRMQPSGSVRAKTGDIVKVYFQAPEKHVALLEGQRCKVYKREANDKESDYPFYCNLRAVTVGTYTFTVTAEDVSESLVIVVTEH